MGQKDQNSSEQNGKGKDVNRLGQPVGEQQKGPDNHEIHNCRRTRRHGETIQRVQRSSKESQEADKNDVREHQAHQRRGQRQFAGVSCESRREKKSKRRRKNDAGSKQKSREQQAEGDYGSKRSLSCFFRDAQLFGEDRDKGAGKRAFSHQTAHQVGYFEGDKESVGSKPCSEKAGDKHIANETENAADYGEESDYTGSAEDSPPAAVRR